MRKHRINRRAHARNRMYEDPAPERLTRAEALRSLGPVVYVARCGDLIKIGHTANLQRRLYELHSDELLGFMPGTFEDEQQIHAQLRDHRHHGSEWYYPTPGVWKVVNDMRECIGQEPIVA